MHDPQTYFDGDDLLPYTYAADLCNEVTLATCEDTNRLYIHGGPCWDPRGEREVTNRVRNHLRNRINRWDVNEIVQNVRSITSQPSERIFDLPPNELVVKNGVIDLHTGEFTPGWDDPGTRCWLDVEYDPTATCPEFQKFLGEVLHPEDVDHMWEVIGYCLYRDYPFEKAVMLLGGGSNGKSAFMSALGDFLGRDNTAEVQLQELEENPFAAARLAGKLANLAPDLDARGMIGTGRFKALTGGDRIDAEIKHKQESEKFRNYATLIFPANRMPDSPDDSYAYHRRWLYFEFPNEFSEDEATPMHVLRERFDGERSGILNGAVEAFGRLWRRGHFGETKFMTMYGEDEKSAVKVASDPVHRFSEDCMIFDGNSELLIDRAYTVFLDWANDGGWDTVGRDEFEEKIEGIYNIEPVKATKDARYSAWPGLNLSI